MGENTGRETKITSLALSDFDFIIGTLILKDTNFHEIQ